MTALDATLRVHLATVATRNDAMLIAALTSVLDRHSPIENLSHGQEACCSECMINDTTLCDYPCPTVMEIAEALGVELPGEANTERRRP